MKKMISRRDFLKVAGISAAALGLDSHRLFVNHWLNLNSFFQY